ncbi:thioesterase family protein [Thermoleophilum album]|uniref:thioesterase family protein n=1 Tax=Thermoleophilum album TaxID=29539 RepID=UPI001C40B90A|nr:thioesterase family protein [Thermoleophilum album]
MSARPAERAPGVSSPHRTASAERERGEPLGAAFYLPLGDGRFRATEWTRGPWSPAAQHGGPPAALLGRCLREQAGAGFQLVRLTLEILRPLPVAELAVRVSTLRPGRRVALLEGSIEVEGQPVVSARAWFVREATVAVPAYALEASREVWRELGEEVAWDGRAEPPGAQPTQLPAQWSPSYLEAVEWRLVHGDFAEPGRASVWTRLRIPLLPDSPATPLERVLAAADSGSGVSSALPFDEWTFVNTDLSVHLARKPRGEWFLLHAVTHLGTSGAGLADTLLADADGPLGRCEQALFVEPRG